MKAADYIARFLEQQGVRTVFELSGGMIAHMLDSFHRLGTIRVVSMHHEQGAAFAADAFGRTARQPGVALATSGPGAVNLLTGIGSCYFDSSPAVFITGQVNRNEQKGDRPIRQLGFQETDIVSMAQPITKAAWKVGEVEEIPGLLDKAFRVAVEGRPGPVLLDIPMDLQRGELNEPVVGLGEQSSDRSAIDPTVFQRLAESLREAKRPLILAGGGVRAARAAGLFREFVELCRVPVAYSLMGVDVLSFENRWRVGLIGSYGNRWANWALGTADLLLVLGSRLDIRQTGSETARFKGLRTIYHVDCAPGEINNRVKGCEPIVASLDSFLEEALIHFKDFPPVGKEDWMAEIDTQRETWPDDRESGDIPGINPNRFIHQLSRVSTAASAYVVDVGQHQMWAAQSVEIGERQRFITSGGMGAMGFALPAAVGVACACPGRPLVVIAGDGGFQCNIQELQTVVRNQMPVKIVIINNRCHGMVRQFQQSYFDSRYQSTIWGYSAPDFVKIAAAYGIESLSVEDPAGVDHALDSLWSKPDMPTLLEVQIDSLANAYPKLAFGLPITEMEPLATPRDMEAT